MSEVKNLAQMGLSEIFEDFTYNVAYSEVLSRLNKNIPVQDGYLKDALQSGLSIVFAGALQIYMRTQDKLLSSIVDKIELVLIALLGNVGGWIKGFFNRKRAKFSRAFRGRAGRALVSVLDTASDNRFKLAKIYCDYGDLIFSKERGKSDYNLSLQKSSFGLAQSDNIATQTRLMAVREMTSSINETLLFKLFTGKFTAKDRAILQKITGSDKVDIDSINKASSFMFVTDDKGNIIGLTQAFIDMLNGLGYLRGKERKE